MKLGCFPQETRKNLNINFSAQEVCQLYSCSVEGVSGGNNKLRASSVVAIFEITACTSVSIYSLKKSD
jgi:hypothetical protein